MVTSVKVAEIETLRHADSGEAKLKGPRSDEHRLVSTICLPLARFVRLFCW
jgi:hypothetical protein